MHGGLLSARENAATEEEMDAFIEKLRKLHEKNPRIPIYAFYVLPRMSPQSTVEDHKEREAIMDLSRLMGKKHFGLPVDDAKIDALVGKISDEHLTNYIDKIDSSTLFAMKLALLANEGVIKRLILSQDDGEPYSIPNIEKEKIKNFLTENKIDKSKVFITHGADEIALTLLAEIKAKEAGLSPKIYVEYNDEKTKKRVMPFMAVSLEDCVKEKLDMLGAEETQTPKEADFTLYISANSTDTMNTRKRSVEDILTLAEENEVALVDLSQHYRYAEILLPLLINENFPINKLLTYAGWNTASNSIGTALATGVMFSAQTKKAKNDDTILRAYYYRLTFLNNRILEDAYYLKDVIDLVNVSLIKEGYKNTADLDLRQNAKYADASLTSAMEKRIDYYKNTKSFKLPIAVKLKEDTKNLRIADIKTEMYFPWPRTFEIRLENNINLEFTD
ncbi:MAG: DUF4127 family protein, partial [Selenomonadaceae bacterium]|nr:DUF4127 family protein [Selenomonadaceae bacterium]